MASIWKFKLLWREVQPVLLPSGAKVLTVQFQRDDLCVWAEVDSEATPVQTFFLIVGTGNPMPDVDMKNFRYLSTVQKDGFVWHVYVEKIEVAA